MLTFGAHIFGAKSVCRHIHESLFLLLHPSFFVVTRPETIMDFDETRIYYTQQQLQQQTDASEDATTNEGAIRSAVNGGDADEDAAVDLLAVRRHFREFLRKSYYRCTIPNILINLGS